jgi:DNA-binding transcriptional MerR regulator
MTSRVTLTQAAKLLRVPQHRLIHLCEEHVVIPEHHDARGRGSRREFSRRNLMEFAVALEMRRLELPVSFVRAVLQVLRTFEMEVQTTRPSFALPESLQGARAPQLSLLILDGERLYFTLGRELAFGGVTIPRPKVRGRARKHESVGRLQKDDLRQALELARTRTEVDVTRIAQDIALKDDEP